MGISEFAQNALGDVVYVDLPQVGATFAKKQTIVAVESVKVTEHERLEKEGVRATS